MCPRSELGVWWTHSALYIYAQVHSSCHTNCLAMSPREAQDGAVWLLFLVKSLGPSPSLSSGNTMTTHMAVGPTHPLQLPSPPPQAHQVIGQAVWALSAEPMAFLPPEGVSSSAHTEPRALHWRMKQRSSLQGWGKGWAKEGPSASDSVQVPPNLRQLAQQSTGTP